MVIGSTDALFNSLVVSLRLWHMLIGGSVVHLYVQVVGHFIHQMLELLITSDCSNSEVRPVV